MPESNKATLQHMTYEAANEAANEVSFTSLG